MKRREFVAAASVAGSLAGTLPARAEKQAEEPSEPFKVLFAPNPWVFKSFEGSYMDRLKFAYDCGFRAWEDNGLIKEAPKLQEQVADFLREHKMTMGVSVVTNGEGVCFYKASKEEENSILESTRKAVECAKRVGHKWMTFIPGAREESKPISEQIQGAKDLMSRCCDLVEEEGLVFVLEPLSHNMAGKPVLVRTFREGFELCEAVNRPSCKILADYFHEQKVAGNLLTNTDDCWKHIAYVQYGDVPGRKEPGTGEINYVNVTKHLMEKGYQGVIGLEHGAAGTIEECVAAYRKLNAEL